MHQPPIEPIGGYLTLQELTAILVRHHGLHEGLFDLSVEIQFAIGSFGPTPQNTLPGALVGVKSVGLVKANERGAHTVDATEVNPAAPADKGKRTSRIK